MSFAVIVPTLQRAPEKLDHLVSLAAAHPMVSEVCIINNAEEPLSWPFTKVKVLAQEANIFVNPAWNLGVSSTSAPLLAIVNDDISFNPEVFDYCAKLLQRPLVGAVTPHSSCYLPVPPKVKISHRFADERSAYRGTFMAMRRETYFPIPEQMKIWGGDDWLLSLQPHPNRVLVHTPFRGAMGTTTHSPEFQALKDREKEVSDAVLRPLSGLRWWHGPVKTLARARDTRHRIQQLLRR